MADPGSSLLALEWRAMPQLLYIHGSGHTQDSFREQVVAFPGSDAVSLPGHPAGQALGTVEESADWLARYLEWKQAGPALIAGNSLGGAIALQLAFAKPSQVAGLILIGTGARLRVTPDIFRLLDEQWPACIDTLVDWSLAPTASAELRARAKEWHLAVGRAATKTDYAACDRFDVTTRLGELQTPALILVGALDRMTPVKYSTFLHERIAGSTLAIIPDAGHLVMAEKPQETNAAIAAFLRSVA
jgi:pimeloyl-ACP methyl ester carboxylesterase